MFILSYGQSMVSLDLNLKLDFIKNKRSHLFATLGFICKFTEKAWIPLWCATKRNKIERDNFHTSYAYCGMANKATPFLSFILFISCHFITSSLSAFDFFPISFIACIGFHVLAPLLFYSCLFFHFTDNFSLKIMWLLLYTRICIYICMLFSFF